MKKDRTRLEVFLMITGSKGGGRMNAGARNQLVGEVTEITRGTVMSLTKVKIPAEAMMASVMTLESLDDLGLKEGDKVRVIVKAVNVLLVKD